MDISGYEGHREIGDVGVAAKGVESRCCCRCISVGMGFSLDPVSVLLESIIRRLLGTDVVHFIISCHVICRSLSCTQHISMIR